MVRVLSIAALMLLSTEAAAYDDAVCATLRDKAPELLTDGIKPIDFVPRGWKLYDKVDGDLNSDGVADSVLVVQRNEPAGEIENPDDLGYDRFNCNPRMLLIVLSVPEGRYRLGASDGDIIPDWGAPTYDDPYREVTVKDGSVVLELGFWANAGSWLMFNRVFRFRWNGREMPLIGYDATLTHRASGEMKQVSVNYLTGKRQDAEGSISDETTNWVWSDMPKRPSPILGKIGDGYMFEP